MSDPSGEGHHNRNLTLCSFQSQLYIHVYVYTHTMLSHFHVRKPNSLSNVVVAIEQHFSEYAFPLNRKNDTSFNLGCSVFRHTSFVSHIWREI